jgi:SPX domain/EXS family
LANQLLDGRNMVEFGLKLEDNKVSEWSDYYLNYEDLKAMLKKAKVATKKYEDQAKKRPQDAPRILEAHRAGFSDSVMPLSPTTSRASLTDLVRSPSRQDTKESNFDDSNAVDAEREASERTGLLASSERSGLSSRIHSTIFSQGLSEYFDSRFERTLRNHLQDIDVVANEFAEAIVLEQAKCVRFYNDKLGELEKRLSLLIETVANSAMFRRSIQPLDEEDSTGSARLMKIGHHRRTSSEMNPRQRLEMIIKTFQKKINENAKARGVTLPQKLRAAQTTLANEDSDEEDFLNNEKVMAEADSIKRALIDQYRTAKLLQNYVILNYTGFIKIVKKHDKTLPEQKGRFKDILKAENLFKEGKAVEKLSNEYETYYANWFCEGDIRAAHAQMLPKRGDGLEMDWSQLRLGYRMGMCAVLALWVCWDSVWGLVADGNSTIGGRSAFPVFRACGGILLLQWFWGCSVFIWTRYRINYIYLFDFNPKIVETPLGIFEDAVDNTLVFNLLMLLYYKVSNLQEGHALVEYHGLFFHHLHLFFVVPVWSRHYPKGLAGRGLPLHACPVLTLAAHIST